MHEFTASGGTGAPPAPVHVERVGPTLIPDHSRVLMRPFFPHDKKLTRSITARVMALSARDASRLLDQVLDNFKPRHERVERTFLERYIQIRHLLDTNPEPTTKQKTLLGSSFSHEYATEAAALFNPSIVPHPDQEGVPAGSLRFILSLRGTGEGHISSITFRQGLVSANQHISLTPPVPFCTEPAAVPRPPFTQAGFIRELHKTGLENSVCRRVIDRLPDAFTLDDLRDIIDTMLKETAGPDSASAAVLKGVVLAAESNYTVRFESDSRLSQRILFPAVPCQSNGIEDARFSRFRNEGGTFTYYATYTAYDGRVTMPQLLATDDFLDFSFITLNGPAVRNKGMALFPRKINGRYAMLSRQDDENILLMYADDLRFWQNPTVLLKPEQSWELVKIGTCGSPIETDAGWLVLTHGVGPMRRYCLGAVLLDLADPGRVIGRLREPLLAPNETEREGYVPNVVYTCGALLHGRTLIIPYAMSDFATSFATVLLDDLLGAMER